MPRKDGLETATEKRAREAREAIVEDVAEVAEVGPIVFEAMYNGPTANGEGPRAKGQPMGRTFDRGVWQVVGEAEYESLKNAFGFQLRTNAPEAVEETVVEAEPETVEETEEETEPETVEETEEKLEE